MRFLRSLKASALYFFYYSYYENITRHQLLCRKALHDLRVIIRVGYKREEFAFFCVNNFVAVQLGLQTCNRDCGYSEKVFRLVTFTDKRQVFGPWRILTPELSGKIDSYADFDPRVSRC